MVGDRDDEDQIEKLKEVRAFNDRTITSVILEKIHIVPEQLDVDSLGKWKIQR